VSVHCSDVCCAVDGQQPASGLAIAQFSRHALCNLIALACRITFVLVHFSLRYKDDEIRSYFQSAGSDGTRPKNVVLWLDSGIDVPPLSGIPEEDVTVTRVEGGGKQNL